MKDILWELLEYIKWGYDGMQAIKSGWIGDGGGEGHIEVQIYGKKM